MTGFLPHASAPRLAAAARACAAWGALVAPGVVFGQPALPASPQVIVTGNPLARSETIQPASVLSGDGLLLRRSGTLGDTLDGLPGVAATGFGPQSSRPVIRGLDGDRVRLLDNGGAAVDASNLSFDHAVAIDPLVVERIEVLRGPAALLYGGNATGGVVNLIDNRIPRTPLSGLGGRAEVRLGGAASQRGGAVVLEGGGGGAAGGWSWHVDAAGRRTEDQRVPDFKPPAEDGAPVAARDRVVNSAGDSSAGAVGLSWSDRRGHLGVAVDSHRNEYGVVVEPDVIIRLRRERLALSGERRELAGPFTQVEFQAGTTRYRHEEVEGSGEVGTTFRSTGHDLRVQARHAPVGPLTGVIGLQAESLDFSALGEEAFVPGTTTRSTALFALEEAQLGSLRLSGGVRVERVEVSSDGDAAAAAEPRFGPARSRRYSPTSLSLAALWPVSSAWTVTASAGRTERAPAYYELYADGVHVATGTYERGDPDLGVERSVHGDLGLRFRQGDSRVQATAFVSRFDRYIALDDTGQTFDEIDEDGNPASVPVYAFASVPARLHGVELEAATRWQAAGWAFDLDGSIDMVRGHNRDTRQPLPRLAPWRARAGLQASRGAWTVGGTLVHAASQDRVPAFDVPTPSYTLLNASLTWRQTLGDAEALWFLRLDNLTDELAFNASALRTARELSPLAARSASVGVQVAF